MFKECGVNKKQESTLGTPKLIIYILFHCERREGLPVKGVLLARRRIGNTGLALVGELTTAEASPTIKNVTSHSRHIFLSGLTPPKKTVTTHRGHTSTRGSQSHDCLLRN